MGFPTINVSYVRADLVNAREGIFAALVKIRKRVWSAVGFFGVARTFGEKEKRVEVHIFDFKKSLLGKKVEVLFIKRLRGNKKFKSAKALAAQMKKDEIMARNFFQRHAPLYVYRNSRRSNKS